MTDHSNAPGGASRAGVLEMGYRGRSHLDLPAENFFDGDCEVLGQTVASSHRDSPATDPSDDSRRSPEARLEELTRLRARVAELEAAHARLTEVEAKYRVIVDCANDAIVVAQDGIIRFVNRKAIDVSGYSEEELTSRPFVDFIHPADRELVAMRHQIGLRGEPGQGLIYPFRIINKDGHTVWVEINPVSVSWDGVPATLNLLSDITERKRAEKTIMHLAYHDALTGLPNRMLFNDRLSVALSQAKRSRSRLALMLLDLDRFKEINDTFGHTVGDELLRRTGDRVSQLLRKADTVARMGGDEFMLLLPEINRAQDAAAIAEKVLDAIRQPVRLDGRSVTVLASLGTVVYPDDGEDSDTLMRRVDQAMYRAKADGGDRHNGYATCGGSGSAGSSRSSELPVNDRVSR